MKTKIALSLLVLLAVTTLAFGHAGEVHSYMGTITTLHDDGGFLLEKPDGKSVHVEVAEATRYLHADGHAGKASELKAGARVVVKMSKDGKTALSVKTSAAAK
jgi:hypothetical protein